ncbi:MAG: hypothetical protein LBQ84_08675 [Flavobacteriaceae bacterium]|jgi:hypothetical protein|nr:hypothetical protein [Flavobacteriaceae bacterium]
MIKYIKYKDIDFNKYDDCIKNAVFYSVYAESWYLKCTCTKGFDVLIYKDYEAVMPLPLQKKIFFKWIAQPKFCQQLGVFYRNKISPDTFRKFENFLHKLNVRGYNFNEENTKHFSPEGVQKVNQVLLLNKDYPEIYRSFNKNRKRNFRRKSKEILYIEEYFNAEEYINMVEENQPELSNKNDNKTVKKLFYAFKQRNKAAFLVVRNQEDRILIWAVFVESGNRIILLMSVRSNKEETKSSYTSLLINHIIENNSNSDKILDFEGSMIPKINSFNESFGATTNLYTTYKNMKRFDIIKKMVKK